MKAMLVYATVITRVVVADDATHEQIDEVAIPRLLNNIYTNGIGEYIDNYEPDIECPYDPESIDANQQ